MRLTIGNVSNEAFLTGVVVTGETRITSVTSKALKDSNITADFEK
jgi:hypothetical protein